MTIWSYSFLVHGVSSECSGYFDRVPVALQTMIRVSMFVDILGGTVFVLSYVVSVDVKVSRRGVSPTH